MTGLVAAHWKLATTNWEQLSRQIFLQLHKKLPKNSSSTILHSFSIWSKLERWKSSISGCFMSWLKNQNKVIVLKCHFSYSLQQQQTVSRSDCDVWRKVDFIQPVMTSSVARPRRSSKALPQTKLASKNKWSWTLVVSCQSDPLQLPESWQNHYIWKVCSANGWDTLKTAMPAVSTGQRSRPSSSARQRPSTPRLQKLNESGCRVLPRLP